MLEKLTSRKFWLTAFWVIVYAVAWVFKYLNPMAIIPLEQLTYVVAGVTGAYLAANVLESKNPVEPK